MENKKTPHGNFTTEKKATERRTDQKIGAHNKRIPKLPWLVNPGNSGGDNLHYLKNNY
jgi:hypothetical protein